MIICASLDLFEKRSAITQLFLNGASKAKIFRDLGSTKYSRSFISRTVKRFKETGKIEDKHRSGRPRTIRTGANVRKIRQMLTRKPTLSHRSVAARARISRASARRIITKDHKLQSYKKSQTEALTRTTIEKRRVSCRKLLEWLKSANSDNIVVSGGKVQFPKFTRIFYYTKGLNMLRGVNFLNC